MKSEEELKRQKQCSIDFKLWLQVCVFPFPDPNQYNDTFFLNKCNELQYRLQESCNMKFITPK